MKIGVIKNGVYFLRYVERNCINKEFSINELKTLFANFLIPFEIFENSSEDIDEENSGGICDVIDYDEMYWGFSYEYINDNKIKIKGVYYDS